MITTKKHKKIVAEIVQGYEQKIAEYKEKADLKHLLNKLIERSNLLYSGSNTIRFSDSGRLEVEFPNDIPRYVEDYFGGKVFKQEANTVVVLSKDGSAKYYQTKKSPDKGYSYILVRE